MNYNRKALEDLYGQVAGQLVPHKGHLDVIGEDLQGQLFRQTLGGKRKGEERAVTQKDREEGKYDVEDGVDIALTDDDISNFKLLDKEDQLRVKKYIESKALRGLMQDTLRGSQDEVEEAFRLLMSSHLTGDDIHEVMQDINTGKAVNTSLLTRVGNYSPSEIFSSEEAWEVYKILMPVGVGKLQQGPGEVAFAMMSPDVDEQTKGDISIKGELYELKVNGGRISDKAGPGPDSIKNILGKYFGEEVMSYFDNQQSLRTSEFVNWVNTAKKNGNQLDFVQCAQEIYSEILDPQHARPIAALFKADQISAEDVIKMFKQQSFEYYKGTKVGSGGQWNKLIGIDTQHKKGSIAVVETGAQFAATPMRTVNPAIVRTKSGTRENYVDFYPQK